jgi:enoyl-[acyl-carrier protein] reductase I
MGLLDGKVVLIFGVANKNSIAWGITKQLHAEGATIAMSYAGEALKKRVMPLAEEVGCDFVEECDVTDDAAMDAVFAKVAERYGKLDVLVHAVAYAKRDDLDGRMVDVSRDGFLLALDISAYSLIGMTRRAEPLMKAAGGGSIMSLTYYAAEKVVPRYNAMAIAKAALENITRYLASDLGEHNIRVNSISAGPIKTLAAAGIPGFRLMLKYAESGAPMQRLVTQDQVGQTALWLASDLSNAVTGEVIHVDNGYHVMGMTLTAEERAYLEG